MTIFYCLRFETPQPGGPGPRIYIFHEQQGGPVITPGTGFLFRRLLRLAGLRWRYSTSPPHNYVSSFYNFGTNGIEITTSNCSSIILCLSVLMGTCVNFFPKVWFSWVYNFQFSLLRIGAYRAVV
jgi:hypothetical protein